MMHIFYCELKLQLEYNVGFYLSLDISEEIETIDWKTMS